MDNAHRRRDEPQPRPKLSSFLYVDDIDPTEKTAWLKAAAKAGMPFTDWVNSQLNRAAGVPKKGE